MKALIIEPCQVNYGDDRGGVHEPEAALIDARADVVRRLVAAQRALYVEKKDDPAKGRDTAEPALLKLAEARRKQADSAEK